MVKVFGMFPDAEGDGNSVSLWRCEEAVLSLEIRWR